MTAAPQISACPACVAGGAAEDIADANDLGHGRIMLSLPEIHCAGCISSVERALQGQSGVRSARVNLTLKRASIEAEDSIDADDLIGVLANVGYEAHELDASALSATLTDQRGKALLTYHSH